jgi:hypothetical protein
MSDRTTNKGVRPSLNRVLTESSFEDSDIKEILILVEEWIDAVDNYDEHSWATNLQDHLR